MKIQYCVVICVPNPYEGDGNLAHPSDIYRLESGELKSLDLEDLSLRQPIFNVGEILILDESGREIGYPQRKPGKWSNVGFDFYDNVQDAILRAQELT